MLIPVFACSSVCAFLCVQVLDRKTQQQLATIILALASGDDVRIAHSLLAAGFSFGGKPSKAAATPPPPSAQPQSQSLPQPQSQSQLQAQVECATVARMAYVLFDTRPSEDAIVSPLSADSILQSTPVTSFNKSLWLVRHCHCSGSLSISVPGEAKPLPLQGLCFVCLPAW